MGMGVGQSFAERYEEVDYVVKLERSFSIDQGR
jgi:hypothetical protein